MPENVQIGYGTQFAYSTDGGVTFITVAKITKFTPPKPSVNPVSIDAFDNPTLNGNPVEDTIPGWVKPGTYGMEIWYQKTPYAALRALLGVNGTKFKVIKADASGYVFTGFLMELGEEIPLKEGMTMSVNVQITGGVAVFSATQT